MPDAGARLRLPVLRAYSFRRSALPGCFPGGDAIRSACRGLPPPAARSIPSFGSRHARFLKAKTARVPPLVQVKTSRRKGCRALPSTSAPEAGEVPQSAPTSCVRCREGSPAIAPTVAPPGARCFHPAMTAEVRSIAIAPVPFLTPGVRATAQRRYRSKRPAPSNYARSAAGFAPPQRPRTEAVPASSGWPTAAPLRFRRAAPGPCGPAPQSAREPAAGCSRSAISARREFPPALQPSRMKSSRAPRCGFVQTPPWFGGFVRLRARRHRRPPGPRAARFPYSIREAAGCLQPLQTGVHWRGAVQTEWLTQIQKMDYSCRSTLFPQRFASFLELRPYGTLHSPGHSVAPEIP